MAADGAPDLGAPAASMDSLPEGEQLQLGIKPSYYKPQENGGESAEDTGHSRRRYGDGQSIHGDTVRRCTVLHHGLCCSGKGNAQRTRLHTKPNSVLAHLS